MAKRIIVEHRNRGCLTGCFEVLVALIVIYMLVSVLAVVGCILAGVGLWFLARYIWRALARERPDIGFVKWGMKMAPITRKVIAGALCMLVSITLIDCLSGAGSANSPTTSSSNSGQKSEQQNEQQSEQNATPVETSDDAASSETEKQTVDMTVHFIDVGQGDSELVMLPDGKTMLIDAGDTSAGQAVLRYLKDQGVSKIDYLVATHPDEDHIGGMTDVLAAFDVGEIWMPDASKDTETFNAFLDAVQGKELTVRKAYAGENIGDSGDYALDILGPAQDMQSEDANDYSVVIKLTYASDTFLFTGDATAQEIIADNPGHIDVLKVAHHGSETGTTAELAKALTPKYAIMSYADGNSYGHPDQSVLDAFNGVSAMIYGTGVNGTVVVTSDGLDISVKTAREGTVVAGVSAAEKDRQEQETAAQDEAQQSQEDKDETVYIAPSGNKYHRSGCRYLRKSGGGTPISKKDAEARGLTPCSVCNP